MKKTGNDLFIVDNSGEEWKVLNYLSEWPGISSRFDIATEQQAQKERLKAQKKAAKASGQKAMPASPTGATSLFDDLADLADAAGADEPKP